MHAEVKNIDTGHGEILFQCLRDPVASWSPPGIRWAVEYWLKDMAYPVGQAWVHVSPYGPFLDWLHVMDGHRRAGIGSALLSAIEQRWPDVICDPATELGELFLAKYEGGSRGPGPRPLPQSQGPQDL